jgi:hypothetical protein
MPNIIIFNLIIVLFIQFRSQIQVYIKKLFLISANPEALINTVWLYNSLHFGMKSRQEHLDMLFVDLELKATSDGLQYFEFTERETKTRKGQGAARSFAPKMLAQPGTYSIIMFEIHKMILLPLQLYTCIYIQHLDVLRLLMNKNFDEKNIKANNCL